jgi:two-component system sensor histidine kinase KdpD
LIPVDDVLMEQLFVNLLENAVKYTAPTERIEIEAVNLGGSRAAVSVRDHGPGFAPDILDRVFDKFFRGGAGQTPGAGLGLAICRAIMTAHQGTISARNMPDGGAAITFELPITGTPPDLAMLVETS